MKNPIKQIKVAKLLDKMIESDPELYERILDTNGFAFYFNELCLLAEED